MILQISNAGGILFKHHRRSQEGLVAWCKFLYNSKLLFCCRKSKIWSWF